MGWAIDARPFEDCVVVVEQENPEKSAQHSAVGQNNTKDPPSPSL